ncbi:MAG: hypothetical protein ACI9JL_004589 [Paracoccaceae bacterium]
MRPASAALDLSAPENKLDLYVRMRGGVEDGELVLWWWRGNVWGKMNDDIAVNLMVVEGLTFHRLTRTSDTTYEQVSAGRGTFRDVESNAPLETWTNPFNGVVGTPDRVVSLNRETVSARGPHRELSDRLIAYEGSFDTPIVNSGKVFMTENFVSKVKGRNAGTVGTTSSLTVFTADAVDMANDDAVFRPCTMNYQSLGGFRPWMGLDNSKGMISWQVYGQKLQGNTASAPDDIKSWVEREYPGFLDDPKI